MKVLIQLKIEPPTPNVNDIKKKIGANNGAKYLKIILKVETFPTFNIFNKWFIAYCKTFTSNHPSHSHPTCNRNYNY